MLDPRITVTRSRIGGVGLVAIAPIRAGETVWLRDPGARDYDLTEIAGWASEEQEVFFALAYQTGEDRYHGHRSGDPDPALFMNHGCDPSCWFDGDGRMTARREIGPGEEVTYDYATSETSADFEMRCVCGASICRGLIRGTDLRDRPELRERYRGHLMAHVERSIAGPHR